MLRASVNGHAAWLLIDTGASVHTLAKWFTTAAGIRTHETGGTATGSTGKTSTVLRVDHVELRLPDGSILGLDEAAVVAFPAVFAKHGIAGLISPQLLAKGEEATVLDLRVPELQMAASPTPQIASASVGKSCENSTSAFRNRLYTAHVSIRSTSGLLTVDTGATGTVIAPESEFAKRLLPISVIGDHVRGVGGTVEGTRRVIGVGVDRGGTSVKVDVLIGGAPGSCVADGPLGMDALRACRVELGAKDAVLICH